MSNGNSPALQADAANVVSFVIGWNDDERDMLQRLFEDLRARRMADAWEIGATERNEPQFYMFNGIAPDAFMSVSRVLVDGQRRYLIENRHGEKLIENADLHALIDSMLNTRGSMLRGSTTRLGWLVAAITAQMAALGVEVTMEMGDTLRIVGHTLA